MVSTSNLGSWNGHWTWLSWLNKLMANTSYIFYGFMIDIRWYKGSSLVYDRSIDSSMEHSMVHGTWWSTSSRPGAEHPQECLSIHARNCTNKIQGYIDICIFIYNVYMIFMCFYVYAYVYTYAVYYTCDICTFTYIYILYTYIHTYLYCKCVYTL